jgi:putative transposase
MDEYQDSSHSKWECQYQGMFIPKCRRKTLYAQLRQHLGEVFRNLAERRVSGSRRAT